MLHSARDAEQQNAATVSKRALAVLKAADREERGVVPLRLSPPAATSRRTQAVVGTLEGSGVSEDPSSPPGVSERPVCARMYSAHRPRRGDPRSRLILREKRTAEEGRRSYSITSSHTGGKLSPMSFAIADVLKLIGPSASIVFAAWIFMGFLQQRYDAALERYRSMIGECRTASGVSDARRRNIREQLATYQRRYRLMNAACNVGLLSAILLILTLIAGELDVIFTGITLFETRVRSLLWRALCWSLPQLFSCLSRARYPVGNSTGRSWTYPV